MRPYSVFMKEIYVFVLKNKKNNAYVINLIIFVAKFYLYIKSNPLSLLNLNDTRTRDPQ